MKFIIVFFALFLSALPTKKGEFALINIYDNAQIEWANKFKIVVVGGVDDPRIAPKLKELHNIKLGYDWLVAFYFYTNGDNNSFVKNLYSNKKITTLNPDGPFLHCEKNGYDWCREYYYNFGSEAVIDKKIKFLIKNLKQKNFNGLFFDWASGNFILSKAYKKVYKTFKKLNPNKNYFQMIGKFYSKLKKKGIFFITNQAFRHHKYLLQFIQYDMTESYITALEYKKQRMMIENKGMVEKIGVTNYYPIDNKSLKATLKYIDLLTKYKEKYKKYGFKNFIYLNYLAPEYKQIYPMRPLYKELSPKNGIFFAFAMAKLTDNIVYSEVSDNKVLEQNPIYFYNLGKVKDKSYSQLEKGIYGRFYENGFVLVSDVFNKDKILKIKINKPFYDVYNDKLIKNSTIKLHYHTDPITHKKVPLGRVFIYPQ